ncbi:DMT family transporter [Smaragdicoccus niigatensis]
MWGLPYLFIKISVAELSPAAIVFARCAIGVVLLLPLAVYRRQIGPVLQHWKPLAAFAIIEICVPWLMLGYAEQKLSSSLTGLLIAAVPIVGAAVAALSGAERLGPARIGGLVAGFVGVAALVGLEVGAAGALPVLAVSLAVVGYTVGPIILSKYLASQPGTAVIALSLAFAVVVYAPFVALDPPRLPVSSSVVLALIGLGVICTAASFIAFYALVGEVGPARAVVVAYVNPAVAIGLGVGLLDEPFTVGTAVGFALIIGGSVLATRPSAPAAMATNPQPAALVDSPIP